MNLHVIDIEELFEVIEKTPNFLEQVEELYEINRVNGRLNRAEREIAQRVLQLSRKPGFEVPLLAASRNQHRHPNSSGCGVSLRPHQQTGAVLIIDDGSVGFIARIDPKHFHFGMAAI